MPFRVYVRTSGDKIVRKLLMKLPDRLELKFDDALMDFARATQKSAKLRAPRDTGFLADQIKVRKTRKGNVVIDTGQAFYAMAQEMGYTPHWIPLEYFKRHKTSPGVPGGVLGVVSKPEFMRAKAFVKKSKPFMRPAIMANFPKISSIFKSHINRAFREARR